MTVVPPLLSVEGLTMRFGGLTAIDGLSFSAAPNEITAIIGPNGAGKTTLFNCLTGFYRPTTGRMILTARGAGVSHALERMAGHRIAKTAGVARTFQNIRLFAGMTVLENLLVAQHNRLMRASIYSFGALFGLKSYRAAERTATDLARHWLDRIGLTGAADQPAGALPYGSQRQLEIIRALCTEPTLLCLDEPAAGLNPHESEELKALLLSIRAETGIGILLIEHDMNVVMRISDHVVVLDHGALIADGKPDDVKRNPAVIHAYLGTPDDVALPPVIAANLGLDPEPPPC